MSDISVGSNVTFLDHRTGEWYPAKVQIRESQSYILTTEQGCTISCNHIDIRPTNVSFNLQTTRVKQHFPVSTKVSHSKPPILPPVSQPQPKPNVAKPVKSHSMQVARNIVKTHSGYVVKPPTKLNL